MNPETLKSERSAKILMSKLDKRYDNAIRARNGVGEKARETGWSEEMFAERAGFEAEMSKVYDEMDALSQAAGRRGWYVKGNWYKYLNSTHASLVAANAD